ATSVMTNAPEFEQAMQDLAASNLPLDVGFHANLTWGRPLSNPKEIPSLVDADGRFHQRIELLKRAISGRVSGEEVYRELRAQLMRLASRTQKISHVDGHHHCHAFPVVARTVEKLAREFKISFVRAPREGFWSPWHWAGVRRLVVASLPASRPSYWRARGFVCPDHFGGFALGAGPAIRERWMESARRLPRGLTEIMVHPGYYSGADRYDAGREQEIAILSDLALADAFRCAGVEITTFANLSS
ncbi:MAG: ChbG/HpnK family deacetylase, partial [bacterium]